MIPGAAYCNNRCVVRNVLGIPKPIIMRIETRSKKFFILVFTILLFELLLFSIVSRAQNKLSFAGSHRTWSIVVLQRDSHKNTCGTVNTSSHSPL